MRFILFYYTRNVFGFGRHFLLLLVIINYTNTHTKNLLSTIVPFFACITVESRDPNLRLIRSEKII